MKTTWEKPDPKLRAWLKEVLLHHQPDFDCDPLPVSREMLDVEKEWLEELRQERLKANVMNRIKR